jgi:ABC-type amino acid transport system permease subunit
MSERQAFYRIVLPQSFRIILPPVLNDLISMLKDSSLVSVIGVQELLTVALGIGRARFTQPEMLAVAALIYLVMSLLCAWLGKRLEERLRRRGTPTLTTGPAAHH